MRRAVLVLLLVACVWGRAFADTYTLSAPPGSGPDESRRLFTPLIDILSRETRETFVYVRPDSWFDYQDGIRKGRFDLLLDDAHLASWRIAALGHRPLARQLDWVRFVAIALKNGKVYSREDLIGQRVCASPPPDLGTVSLLRKFKGPFQVPLIAATSRPLERVRRLLAGECAGAVLSRHLYFESEKIRGVAASLEIITQSDAYPGLTLTAGNRLPQSLGDAVRRILLSRAGETATAELRNRLGDGSPFVAAHQDEYAGLDALLAGYPGFDRPD